MPFQKGHKLSPGRPKGSKSKKLVTIDANSLKATMQAEAVQCLERLLGKAADVIDEALDDGNVTVAMWTMDRLVGKHQTILPDTVDIRLSTIDDVMLAAQTIVEMVMLRKLSVDDASKSLNMLSQYASFRAFERIEDLKALVEEMKAQADAKTIDGEAVLPSWGRLSESSPVANKEPAE